MPDISMCNNKNCPEKDMCYRYRAVPNELWQAYAAFTYDGEDGCDYFWPVDEAAGPVRDLDDVA
jgi:hypothetical protein